MIVIVCGGRDFTDGVFAFAELDRLREELSIDCVVEGGQRTRDRAGSFIGGADYWGWKWARVRGVLCHTERAAWSIHGRSAGMIRNGKMLTDYRPARVIAFAGGRGTADMKQRANARGVIVIEIS